MTIVTHPLIWPSLISLVVSFITAFFIQPWATHFWNSPRIKILGVLPMHLIEPQEDNKPIHRLGLIFKVQNPSPSTGIVHPVATIDGCVKIFRGHDTTSLFQTAEMSLPPDERVSSSGIAAAARRHQHTVQRVFIPGTFRDNPSANIGISGYGTEYFGVVFPLESKLPHLDGGVIGSVSLDGHCSEIKERNTQLTLFHLFSSGMGGPLELRPEFSTGNLNISIQAGTGRVTVPPEVIKPLVHTTPGRYWADLLFQQMYENPSTEAPPTRQVPSK